MARWFVESAVFPIRRHAKPLLHHALTVLLCLMLIFQPMVVSMASAQDIIIDPSGNVGFAPRIQRATRPQVIDIATPNAGGVSLNQYSTFTVTSKGVVLNNSATAVGTTLAGTVQGNTNLTAGSASTIVNEVRSATATGLSGSIEVAGARADVVIANPSGITCSGCNFINAGSGTLTTGTPVITGGTVRLDVTGGTVTIGRGGLTGGNAASVNLIGRTVVIDGRVTAIDGINVQGGAQSYDLTGQRTLGALTSAAAAPEFVIDGTAFGAMEAGRIQVIGNEAGLGVRSLGALQSTTTDVTVTGQGNTTVRSAAATRNVALRSVSGILTLENDITAATGSVTATARQDLITNELTGLFGLTGVSVSSSHGNLTFRGVVQTDAAVSTYARRTLTFGAYGSAGGTFGLVAAGAVVVDGATIVAQRVIADQPSGSFTLSQSAIFSDTDLRIATTHFSLGRDVVVDGRSDAVASNLVVNATGNFTNNADLRQHDTATFTYAGNLVNDVNGIMFGTALSLNFAKDVTNAGLIYGDTSVTLNLSRFFNTATGSVISKAVSIITTGLLENKGTISTDGTLVLTSAERIQNDGIVQAFRATLTAPLVATGGGSELRVRDHLQIAASGSLTSRGNLGSLATITITGGSFENIGAVLAETTLSATVAQIINRGAITAGLAATLRTTGLLRNEGQIISYESATLAGGTRVENTGTLVADQTLSVTGPEFRNIAAASLVRAKVGAITTARIYNEGQVYLVGEFRRRGDIDVFDNSGVFASSARIELTGRDAASQAILRAGSQIISGLAADDATQTLTAAQNTSISFATLTATGDVFSGGTITLAAPTSLTLGGRLQAASNIALSAATLTVAATGVLRSEGGVYLTATTAFTNNGAISATGVLQLTDGLAKFVNNEVITVGSTGKFTLSTSFENFGAFQTTGAMTISALTLTNSGLLASGAGQSLIARRITTDAAGVSTTTLGTLTNNGTVTAVGGSLLTAGAVNLAAGSYLTATQLGVTTNTLAAGGRMVLTGTARNTWTVAQGFSQTGTAFAEGEIRLTAATFTSSAQGLLGSSAALNLITTGAASVSGRLTADTVNITASGITTAATSEVFAAQNILLTSTAGQVLTSGNLIAGNLITVNSDVFDLRGGTYAKTVNLNATTRGYTRGGLFATETATISIPTGGYYNYGFTEARTVLRVTATGINSYAGSELVATDVVATAAGGIAVAGKVTGAKTVKLTAASTVSVATTGMVESVSVALKGNAFTNSGSVTAYGFFGDVVAGTDNYGLIKTETYFGLTTGTFINRGGAQVVSDDHLYIRASGLNQNLATATLRGRVIDLRGGALTNSGTIRATEAVNIAEMTGTVSNVAGATIYGRTIAVNTTGSISNAGKIGQIANATLPVAAQVSLGAGNAAVTTAPLGTVTNTDSLIGTDVQILATGAITNRATISAAEFLGVKSSAAGLLNTGSMRGWDIRAEVAGDFDNQHIFKASNTLSIKAGSFQNREISATDALAADLAASVVVVSSANGIINSGILFGYSSLGLEATGGQIENSGNLTGPDIAILARAGSFTTTAAITAGGRLSIEGRAINLWGTVRVTDEVTLKAVLWDVNLNNGRVETKSLVVDAARKIISGAGAFRGSVVTQLVAADIERSDGNVLNGVSRKLGVIGGAAGSIYVELRTGSLGSVGASIYEATGHTYESVNWDVTGSVSLIANAGNILLAGTVIADDDIYVNAKAESTLLGALNIRAGDVLHLEGKKLLKNYSAGALSFGAGNKVQLSQDSGWFYTADWLARDLPYHLSVKAQTVVINSSHYLLGKELYLWAGANLTQKDQVISARKVTYVAGGDVLVRFNPFTWRSNNPTAAYSGDPNTVAGLGLRGITVYSQGAGTAIYAGQDVTLQSGKIQTGGTLAITAGRNILSEPMFLETGRANRPGDVGWTFDARYTGVLAGHDANLVTIRELRAYENQLISATGISLIAGANVSLVGTKASVSGAGNIDIEARLGSVNMISAPGFWTYAYSKTTTKKKFFGFYKKTTTYEYDALNDIYKPTTLTAANGNIDIRATGTDGTYAAILTAGTQFSARNIALSTPTGNITVGTYAERTVTREETHSSTSLFWFIPFGSEDEVETNNILVNYGNDFFSDERLTLSAPRGTLSITAGTIRATTVVLEAARIEILAAINSAQQTYYSRRDNMITITTIQSGFDRETAALPQITAQNFSVNAEAQVIIGGYRGVTLNSRLINIIGTNTFAAETLGLAAPADVTAANAAAQTVNNDYTFAYKLPGASVAPQYAYVDQLLTTYSATYNPITLRDREWYDKQVQLNPAFRALLQAVVTYATGGVGSALGIGNTFVAAGVNAATSNLIVGVVEGSITGNLDFDSLLRGALLAGISGTITSYVGDTINWGAGLSDTSPFVNDVRGNFSLASIVDRAGDRITNQIITNVVYGQDPFEGFDNLGRTFLVTEVMALAQFGIGELGGGTNTAWEGSVGHLILHGGLGCLALEAMNGDCVAGFFAGASSSLLAGSNLTDEQKLQLAPLVGAFAGYLGSGGNPINVSFGGTIAQSGIENNYLTHRDVDALEEAIRQCKAQSANGECDADAFDDIIEQFRTLSRLNEALLIERCGTNVACLNAGIAQAVTPGSGAFAWGDLLEEDARAAFSALSLQNSIFVSDYVWSQLRYSNQYEAEKTAFCNGLTGAACDQAWAEHGEQTAVLASLLLDFVPILGDLRGAYECLSTGTLAACGGAVVGIVPLAGDLVRIVVRQGDEVVSVVVRESDNTVVEIAGRNSMDEIDFSDEFDLLRGQLDIPSDIRTLSRAQVGAIGEGVARDFLARNGMTPVIQVTNASGNGVDLIVRGQDGLIRFVEVKATATGNIGELSRLQSDPQVYINRILVEIRENETLRGQSVPQDVIDFATDYLDSRGPLSPPTPTIAIGVDLLNEEIFVSPW